MAATTSARPRRKNFPKAGKILLIEPPNKLIVGFNATVVAEPLGLQYLAGNILDLAEVMIYDMRVDTKPLSDVIREFQPDLVGIREGYTVDVDSVKNVASDVKKLIPDVPVIVGGHHVSLSPHDAYTFDIDAIVIGDGEHPFRQLVLSLQKGEGLNKIVDVIFQDDDGNFDTSNLKNMKKSSLKELDSPMMNTRPFPARHLVERYRDKYFFLYHPNPYSVETARGCIYRCNFCSVHEFHRGEYRVQGNDRTLKELSELPRNAWINIVDDLAIPEPPAALKLSHQNGYDPMEELADRLIELDLGQRYWMQVRADNVVRNPKKFEKWARAGLDTTLVGLESFEQDDLNSVSKGTKVEDNEKAIDILHDVGVRIWGAVIVFQSWADKNFENLKEKVYQKKIEFPNYTILTPLPGTGQWRELQHRLVTREPRFFDFLHSVLPTKLSHTKFYEQYASLWRAVGDGGFDRVRKMLQEVTTTRESIMRFLRQYRTLSDVETYDKGIELLEKANAKSASEAKSNA
ncbi:MAG: B12-binding domain-containing radical SAM protein [Dehalococcoidia bacterium]